MKAGDLGRDLLDHSWEIWDGCEGQNERIGLIVAFDKEGDPVVLWTVPDEVGEFTEAYYSHHVELINESR